MPAMIANKLPAAALGLLACVLLFSALLGLTGVANKPVLQQQHQHQQTRAEEAIAVQSLRGGQEEQEARSPIQAVPLGRDEGAMRMEADGVVKPQAAPAKSEDATSLRAIPFSGAVGQAEAGETLTDASLAFPEQKPEALGLWGPDEEERAQLEAQLGEQHVIAPKELPAGVPGAELVWPEQVETHGFWGPDTNEREQLAKLVVNGKWDRLMQEMDDDLSFSFDF